MQVDIISSHQLKIIFFLRIAQLTVRSIFWWATAAILLCKMKSEVIFDNLELLSLILILPTLLLFKWSDGTGLLPLMMLRVSHLWRFLRLRIFINVLIHDYLYIYSC
jgi:hypothetical protein